VDRNDRGQDDPTAFDRSSPHPKRRPLISKCRLGCHRRSQGKRRQHHDGTDVFRNYASLVQTIMPRGSFELVSDKSYVVRSQESYAAAPQSNGRTQIQGHWEARLNSLAVAPPGGGPVAIQGDHPRKAASWAIRVAHCTKRVLISRPGIIINQRSGVITMLTFGSYRSPLHWPDFEFRSAAEECAVSQPALSMQIRELGNELERSW